ARLSVIESVLVANRGEIARRILRAARGLGIRSVAVYSEADAGWPHAREADEAVLIGPAPPRESYLNGERILEAARRTGAKAIHPGYGFLSENWRFAKACEEAGLVFVGPSWRVIQQMGDKVGARREMRRAGVPLVPGSEGPVSALDDARRVAGDIGYPLMLKAAAGGGGIGMVKVSDEATLAQAYATAERRSQAAFGSATLFVERYLTEPRHVEVQVFGDGRGQVVHLHERECSIQRRHQKLIEESPAPCLSPGVKERLTRAAVMGARSVGYVNAGTMEFIVQGEEFYFLEMNTRLQVEHPVTEEVTGLDIVQAQLKVASGESLPWRQEDIAQRGAAIECRIYAEDPARNFMPSPGIIARWVPPSGPSIRVESGVAEGCQVSVHYDPLLAKLVTVGATRVEAIARMQGALEAFVVEGLKTAIPFHLRVMASAAFREGRTHTQMVEQGAFNG
ncbi:MAG TPA: acetyl-CoA carboxylase biotin carboxylase subunit, partial [Candidatus Acidoferrales bacterium]|nr:acetyl-CoA carboxylase biotin carboxylase subunit [Candidatus Acidoferrales bacterium]